MVELRLFIANQALEYPELADDLEELLRCHEAEIEAGESYFNEIFLCRSQAEDMIRDYKNIM